MKEVLIFFSSIYKNQWLERKLPTLFCSLLQRALRSGSAGGRGAALQQTLPLLPNRKSPSHHFPLCSRMNSEGQIWLARGQSLTLGEAATRIASEFGCEVWKTARMTFGSGFSSCHWGSPRSGTAADKQAKIKRWRLNLPQTLKPAFR